MSRFKEYLTEGYTSEEAKIFAKLMRIIEAANPSPVEFTNIAMRNEKLCFDARLVTATEKILHSFEIDMVKKH